MRIVHFCPDDRASSGVNTFCVELDRHLRALGVDSSIMRTYADLVTSHQPPFFTFTNSGSPMCIALPLGRGSMAYRSSGRRME